MCYEEKYNQKVKEHNENGTSEGCKYLEDIKWKLEDKEFIRLLLKENRVIPNIGEMKFANQVDGEKHE